MLTNFEQQVAEALRPSKAAIEAVAKIICTYGDQGWDWDSPYCSDELRQGSLEGAKEILEAAYVKDAPRVAAAIEAAASEGCWPSGDVEKVSLAALRGEP